MRLHTYWRSSAAYRVRIALNLKGVEYQPVFVPLVGEAAQRSPEYRTLNPQGLVPTLVDDQLTVTQSLAIIEYLEERYPEPPLLPKRGSHRAMARQIAQIVASDIHPLNNLRVLQYLKGVFKVDDAQKDRWYRHWIVEGFDAIELWLASMRHAGPYALGAEVTMADVCLVPQVYNARRFHVPMDDFPRIKMVDEACLDIEAFRRASPEAQPDAP